MRALARAYDVFLEALAVLASVMLALIFAVIVLDVTMRELGYRPPAWTTASSEYALLYATTLAAPWLLRVKGHIVITTFVRLMPRAVAGLVEKAMCALGAAVCLIVAGFAVVVVLTVEGLEIRSFVMPRWVLFVSLPPCFLLLAVEFLRFLLGRDSLHGETTMDDEGL